MQDSGINFRLQRLMQGFLVGMRSFYVCHAVWSGLCCVALRSLTWRLLHVVLLAMPCLSRSPLPEEHSKRRAQLWSAGLRCSSSKTTVILLLWELSSMWRPHVCNSIYELSAFALGFLSMSTISWGKKQEVKLILWGINNVIRRLDVSVVCDLQL